MKKILTGIFTLALLASTLALFAGDSQRPVKTILNDILKEQGVSDQEKINPKKVSPKLLEELGEAVMDLRHPDEQDQKWMEEMMGGQDSSALQTMRRFMGYRYLNGFDRGFRGVHGFGGGPGWMRNGRGEPGMMNDPEGYGPGRGMPGFGPYGGYGFRHGFLGGGWMLILILVVLALLVFGGIKYAKTVKTAETPLDVLKKRYARGEITKEEFESIKKDL